MTNWKSYFLPHLVAFLAVQVVSNVASGVGNAVDQGGIRTWGLGIQTGHFPQFVREDLEILPLVSVVGEVCSESVAWMGTLVAG